MDRRALVKNAPMFKKTTVGFIIEALARFENYVELIPKIKDFVEPYLESEMRVVATKAKRTMKKLNV